MGKLLNGKQTVGADKGVAPTPKRTDNLGAANFLTQAKLASDRLAKDAYKNAESKERDQLLVAACAHYKSLDRFDNDKKAILEKFGNDKKC